MPELILALDVGTSALGVGVFQPDGALRAFVSRRLRSTSPGPGRVEQDGARVWRAAHRTMSDCLAAAGAGPEDLAAVGVTTQRTSIMVWDRRTGAPLAPMVVWSDLRGVRRAAELQGAGFMVFAQQAAAKLEDVLSNVPREARAEMLWGSLDAYVIWMLSGGGAHVTDRSQAWPTGYLDLATMSWREDLIAHQGLEVGAFPRLVDTFGVMGRTARRVFGAEVPIAADVADQQAALIAHGGRAGDAKVTFGTSATMNLGTGDAFVLKSMTAPPFVQSFVGEKAQFCLEGMVYSAGSALDWLRSTFRFGSHAVFDGLAASSSDAGGVTFLPALQGLGAPYGEPARRGALHGLSMDTERRHIARAGLEGVAYRVREVFENLYDITGLDRPEALGVDGGLSGSDLFLQVQADLLGRPIQRHRVREATACGAAICAGLGVGLLKGGDLGPFVAYDRVFEPRHDADASLSRFSAWKAAVYGSTV